MKLAAVFLMASLSLAAVAQEIGVKDYQWKMTDISSLGLNKEDLYTKMDRKFIRPGGSICSNRAHMWAADFKTKYDINTAKIFLFYGEPEKKTNKKTWWYHVAPVVNEKGQEFVLDAGFGNWIPGPLTITEWLKKFANSTNCKEINANETELVELIFKERAFPRVTSYGKYDCYYKITPHTFWIPETVVRNLLGRDSQGRPVHLERPEIDSNELYQACLEATSTKLGYALGANKEKCKEYVANSRL